MNPEDKRFRLLWFVWENLKLTTSQRRQLAIFLGECEQTGFKCIPEAHRVGRGNKKGEYTLSNILWVCNARHKEFHAHEPGCRKR